MPSVPTLARGRIRPATAGMAVILFWATGTGSACGQATSGTARHWADERVAGPFQVHADFSLESHTDLLHELGRLERDVVERLGLPATGEPMQVMLFQQRAGYQRYLAAYFPRLPYRRALFAKGQGQGMVFAYAHRELDVDVRHECTHAVLHSRLPLVPLWLDEGLAEYFEVPAGQRVADHPHHAATRWRLRLGARPDLEGLEGIHDFGDLGKGEYIQAWAWVHFMLHGSPAAYDELRRYLADLQAHRPPGQLSRRLRNRLPDLDEQFRRHFLENPTR